MSLSIYFLRHGQTTHSRDELFSGSGTDAQLTSAGVQMADEFAHVYESTPWAAIYVSPQTRARETARPTAERTKHEVIIDERLREIGYGEWEGRTIAEVKAKYQDAYTAWLNNPAVNRPPSGETAVEIAERGTAAVESISKRHSSGAVLVVSHKATIRIILCSLLGIDLASYRHRLACPVCSLSIVEIGEHGPLLKVLADRSHLSEALRKLPGS